MEPSKISFQDGKLNVPNYPIIPVIHGDGIGIDITPVAIKVLDAAIEKAYSGSKKIDWMKILAGEEANDTVGEWLP